MKINKSQVIKAGLVIVYMLYFMFMQMLFASVSDWINTSELLGEGFYHLYWNLLALIKFFQWFFLGVLLYFLGLKKRPRFHFSIGLFLIALVWMAVAYFGFFPYYSFFSWYGHEYKEFFLYAAPIFSGFFLLKSLVTGAFDQGLDEADLKTIY